LRSNGKIREVEKHLLAAVNEHLPELCDRIEAGKNWKWLIATAS